MLLPTEWQLVIIGWRFRSCRPRQLRVSSLLRRSAAMPPPQPPLCSLLTAFLTARWVPPHCGKDCIISFDTGFPAAVTAQHGTGEAETFSVSHHIPLTPDRGKRRRRGLGGQLTEFRGATAGQEKPPDFHSRPVHSHHFPWARSVSWFTSTSGIFLHNYAKVRSSWTKGRKPQDSEWLFSLVSLQAKLKKNSCHRSKLSRRSPLYSPCPNRPTIVWQGIKGNWVPVSRDGRKWF